MTSRQEQMTTVWGQALGVDGMQFITANEDSWVFFQVTLLVRVSNTSVGCIEG